jgi:phosphoserine phosphatase
MSLVATLISHPQSRALTASVVNKAARHVGATSVRWLADSVACDLVLPEAIGSADSEAALRVVVAGHPLDVVVQNQSVRRKRILIADMDSTMIDQECIDELADEIGVKDHVAAITARSMNGEIAFEPALRERVALLRGLDVAVIDRIVEGRLTIASGGRVLVATMRRDGAWTALVSGGFTAFTTRISEMLGFDENRANVLLASDGRLSGTVAEPILGREAKAVALAEIAARLDLDPSHAIAVGDGANDLDMLELAGAGVALHAKPAVAARARMRVDHGDLTALLYIQGYAETEFAT